MYLIEGISSNLGYMNVKSPCMWGKEGMTVEPCSSLSQPSYRLRCFVCLRKGSVLVHFAVAMGWNAYRYWTPLMTPHQCALCWSLSVTLSLWGVVLNELAVYESALRSPSVEANLTTCSRNYWQIINSVCYFAYRNVYKIHRHCLRIVLGPMSPALFIYCYASTLYNQCISEGDEWII